MTGKAFYASALGGLLLWAVAAGAGETLVSEDFEKLDLNGLPQGWRVSTPDEVSISVDSPGNKVLRIAHKGKGMAELLIPLNIEQVRGRTIHVNVRMKCPTGYEPEPDKQRAPQLMIAYRAKSGSSNMYGAIPPTHRNWVGMAPAVKIPADVAEASVCLRVNWVVCEAYFDNLTITVDGEPVAAQGAAPAAGGGTVPPTDPALASVPRKTVEEHGARMGPEVIAMMRALRRPGASANTYAVLGPTAPLKELEGPKPIEQWARTAVPKELTGVAATPESLFLSLPAFLIAKKPEIVILACGTVKERKAPYNERYDWEDLARLCLRFGALPVLAVPSEKAECASRGEMLEAIKSSNLPAVEVSAPVAVAQVAVADQGVPSAFPQRVAWIFGLLEKHVCGRTPAATDDTTKAGGKSGEVE